ncbi:MAG: dTDP-4-dehydrorhamnose 3,5-epimerase [Cytophagales bacterium]|nr:dTDP-4-dehydrorhamnose 3,5-epimerase [Cytophagales bacterium]
MKITETPLKDCYLVESTTFGDERGFFMEAFNKQKLKEELNVELEIKQVNFASSSKNVLRGLHYQDAPHSQTKLVGVTHGAVLDVAVDLRKNSPSYLKSYSVLLDHPSKLFLVPKGFAHGYYTMSDDTLFFYFVDTPYSPQHELGILYNDPELAVDWGQLIDPVVSKKDLNQPTLDNVRNHF